MNVVAIVQARMGSTRLPGKVLLPLGSRTVLEHVLLRLRAAAGLDTIVVATTSNGRDDNIAAVASARGARVYRGSESDVLARYAEAASEARADAIVRITADCPLLDPYVAAAMIERFRERNRDGRLDYLSNGTDELTFPRGLDVEVVRGDVLKTAALESRDPFEREHVTPFVYRHPERFSIETFERDPSLGHLRWTIDEPDDYRFLQAVVDAAGPRIDEEFSHEFVLEILSSHPDFSDINAHVRQKVE